MEEHDPNKYYEIQVTDPFGQLIMGREYLVDGTDMIYLGSRGTNMYGEGENGEYNFRTPNTVTPSNSIWIRSGDFNNHNIIQKARSLSEVIMRDVQATNPDYTKYNAVDKASGNDDIFNEIMKFGGKKRKNKSRKVKKSRRKKRKSLKKRRKTRSKK